MASPLVPAAVEIDPVPGGIVPDNAPYTFTATLTGGNYDTAQFVWGVFQGNGSINANTGVYTPPTATADESVTILLTVIFYGNGTNAPRDSITTRAALNYTFTVRHFGPALAPMVTINAPAQINEDQTVQLTTTLTGGAYDDTSETWSLVSGGGDISVGGLYNPPNVVTRTNVEIRVEVTVLGDGTTTTRGSTATADATVTFMVLAVSGVGDAALQIGPDDATGQLLADSLYVTQEIRGVGTAAFMLRTEVEPGQTLVTPDEGQQVAVAQDGRRTFLGELRDVSIDSEDDDFINWACRAVDYRAVLNDRVVTIETDNVRRVIDIVQLLQNAALNSEGILPAASNPVGTNVVPANRWPRRTVTDILDEIMVVENWVWRINFRKELVWGPYGQIAAPQILTDSDVYQGQQVNIEKTKDDYANKVIFVGGTELMFVGGEARVVGGVVEVTVKDQAEIDRRAVIEGGSGIHEITVEDPTVRNVPLATARANGILARRKQIATKIVLATDQAGFEVGQSMRVRLTKPRVDDTFLIERIGIRTLNPATGKARYTIHGRSSGVLENLGTYIAALKKK